MKTRLTWLLILMLALTVFWGCSDDDDPVDPDPTATAFEVMAAAGAAYINDVDLDCPGTLSAATLEANPELYTVIDIRDAADYYAGHIPGAYNSSLGSLVADLSSGAIPSGKTYVVACYTGQAAGHAKIAMELLGYGNVKTLLFGMSSWKTDFEYTVDGVDKFMDSWTGKCGDALTAPETTNNNSSLATHTLPTLSENVSTVVADRVNAMLSDGFKGISYEALDALNPNDVFIINYFGAADYEGSGTYGTPGHIPGAFQFTPYSSMGIDQMLDQIPTDKKVVVYCWTGQHSSQITAYLNMLDYDAYSLTFGSNYLFHTNLTGHKWTAAQHNDFALEMGYPASETFTTIATALYDYVDDSAACPGYITAASLEEYRDLYTVVDIRNIADFDAGHIPGAIHSELGTLRADIADNTIPTNLPIVVACYTGQGAGHAKIALEMMGYDSFFLLWGMSSWNTEFTYTIDGVEKSMDSWTSKIGDNLNTIETANNNGDLEWHEFPDLTGETLDSRVDAMLAAGFQGKPFTGIGGIEDYLGNYFIINYFGEADYLGAGGVGVPGHIPGAFQFTPYLSMGVDEMLGNIPSDMPIIVYCWTGQHSSQITAYLNMLGYEAYSLKFGSNNLFHTALGAHKWTESAHNDFALETTPVLVTSH